MNRKLLKPFFLLPLLFVATTAMAHDPGAMITGIFTLASLALLPIQTISSLIILKLKVKKIFRRDLFAIIGVGMLLEIAFIIIVEIVGFLKAFQHSSLFFSIFAIVHTVLLIPFLKKETRKTAQRQKAVTDVKARYLWSPRIQSQSRS